MLYAQHGARPPIEIFDRHKDLMPNCSMRMSNLVAAILRPQIKLIDERAATWRAIHGRIADALDSIDHIFVPARPDRETCAPSSIQFSLVDLMESEIERFLDSASARGVHIKWFGRAEPEGFTFTHRHWRYITPQPVLRTADRVLKGLCDMRLPLGLSKAECDTVVQVVREAIEDAVTRRADS